MKLLAIFTLNQHDELSAALCDVETKELLTVINDDPSDSTPFQTHVEATATALGHEIVEWDRSALARGLYTINERHCA